MLQSSLKLYKLREPYFKGQAAVLNLRIGDETFSIDVDQNGQFLWNPDANFPIGVYARPVEPVKKLKLFAARKASG